MTVDQLKSYFGTDEKAGKVLGYKSKATVSTWRKKGGIPYGVQCDIEILTKGKLKARREHDPDNVFYQPEAEQSAKESEHGQAA